MDRNPKIFGYYLELFPKYLGVKFKLLGHSQIILQDMMIFQSFIAINANLKIIKYGRYYLGQKNNQKILSKYYPKFGYVPESHQYTDPANFLLAGP